MSDLNAIVDDEDDVAIAAITAAELLVGVALADAANRKKRRDYVERILLETNLENYGLETARAHGDLLAYVRRKGRPRGAHDLIIAATAAATTREVVTSNGPDFEDLPGVRVRVL